ncbi:phosphotransferase family protein [Halorarum salinum]|uniref:Phosphotransferase family protein n=1 Tax=Halorarum salinum TaxID=2743089 RepID=A0A7D5L8P4_9EURY|nr:phosphotransferase family protein [Halobaculum salinum]QLG60674.1 phosphotransferase family protein [Halobaculum salinum]
MDGVGHGVDRAELAAYLSTELDVEVTDTEVLSDKLNLIVAISTPDDERAYVLHRPNGLRKTDPFNDLEQEYRVLQRLQDAAIPTQTPVLFREDDSIVGDAFVVTTHLDGEPIPLGTDLPERFRDPGARSRVARLLTDTLADINTLDVEPFEGVCERKPPLEQVVRAADRLDAATDVTGRDLPTLRSVGDWLRENPPSEPVTALVHGDYRPGNVLFAGTEDPQLAGGLDWETATLGDPRTDLGYLLLRWRDDGDPTPSLDALEGSYSRDAMRGLEAVNGSGLCPFSAKPGGPDRRELVARWEERTGIPFEHERFFLAHAAFGLATVWEDLYRHRLDASGESGKGAWTEYVARLGASIVDGEFDP